MTLMPVFQDLVFLCLFVDDLKFYRTVNSAEDERLLQIDIDNFVLWCKFNCMSLKH